MNLLGSIPDLLAHIPIRQLTAVEITHLKFLNIFTTELVRLSKLAFQKIKESPAPTV